MVNGQLVWYGYGYGYGITVYRIIIKLLSRAVFYLHNLIITKSYSNCPMSILEPSHKASTTYTRRGSIDANNDDKIQ